MSTAGDRAIFLDRDGTLVEPRHYPSRPADLILFAGIGPELRALQGAGFRLVVITNQSGLARGLFGADDLTRMHEHLGRELARFDVTLDGIYHCPHHLDGVVPALAIECVCRKPRPGMLLQAAADLDLDLERSWLIGDILDDIEAGGRAGCRRILVDLGTEDTPPSPLRRPNFVARDTRHALQIIRALEGLADSTAPAPDLTYQPARWHEDGGSSRVSSRAVGQGTVVSAPSVVRSSVVR